MSRPPYQIPARFVLARLLPTPAELVYGYQHGWLADSDVVTIAVAVLESGRTLSQPEVGLALLLSEDIGQVATLVGDLETTAGVEATAAAAWLFLALSWLYEHRTDVSDPFEVIEILYADFDYPADMQGLVRFMPPAPGEATGLAAIEERWRAYISRLAASYRRRTDGDTGTR